MSNVAQLFRDLIRFIWDEKKYEPGQYREADRLAGLLYGPYAPATDRTLDAVLPEDDRLEGDLGDYAAYLYLEPIQLGYRRWLLPLLTFCYRFRGDQNVEDNEQPDKVRLQLGLFTSTFNYSEKVRSIGFRLETSEGEGRHNYCHAQPIQQFRRNAGNQGLTGVPPWLPTSDPTLPLDAFGPPTLLISLLVSLYGSEVTRHIPYHVLLRLRDHGLALHAEVAGFDDWKND